MFSVAAATGLAKPFGVGGRRPATGRIRRGELDAAFFPPQMQLPTATTKMIVTLRIEVA
jgi:hypothetical protein